MLVMGAKEVEANAVAVRSRKAGDVGQMPVDEFIAKIQEEKDIIDNNVDIENQLEDNKSDNDNNPTLLNFLPFFIKILLNLL